MKLSQRKDMKIAEDITHIVSCDVENILLFSERGTQMYNASTRRFSDAPSKFYFDDFLTVSHICQPVKNIHASFTEFFKINTAGGFIYTKKNLALWRSVGCDNESIEDTILFTLNGVEDEKIVLLDFICVPELSPDLNTCLAIG